jgi:hypothetical protein
MRTLKQDRELAIKIAEGLGHEMGPWRSWFFRRKAICSCKLCNDWVGLGHSRDWEYDPDSRPLGKNIHGTAIDPRTGHRTDSNKPYNFGFRKNRCRGIKERAKRRSRHTQRVKQIIYLIENHTAKEAAEILCGEYPDA